MEEHLSQLIEENASLSCVTSSLDMSISEDGTTSSLDGSGNNSVSSALSRRSVYADHADVDTLLRLISDGATRFLHRQIVEIANGVVIFFFFFFAFLQCRTVVKHRVQNAV